MRRCPSLAVVQVRVLELELELELLRELLRELLPELEQLLLLLLRVQGVRLARLGARPSKSLCSRPAA